MYVSRLGSVVQAVYYSLKDLCPARADRIINCNQADTCWVKQIFNKRFCLLLVLTLPVCEVVF